MRPLDHKRHAGYLAAMKQIGLNAKYPPPPKLAWWKLIALTLRGWAYGRI